MRKMLTALCFILCLGSMLAPDSGLAQTGENEFGFYTDPTGDPASVNAEANVAEPIVVYFVLTNPVNHDFYGEDTPQPVTMVEGWEAKILVPTSAAFFILQTIYPVPAIDVGTKPSYVVGFSLPVPVIGRAVTLMTMSILVIDTAPYEIYLGLTEFPSIPGAMAYVDAGEPESNDLVPAWPSSGSFDTPVFSINSPGAVVATENESWGGVKALYR